MLMLMTLFFVICLKFWLLSLFLNCVSPSSIPPPPLEYMRKSTCMTFSKAAVAYYGYSNNVFSSNYTLITARDGNYNVSEGKSESTLDSVEVARVKYWLNSMFCTFFEIKCSKLMNKGVYFLHFLSLLISSRRCGRIKKLFFSSFIINHRFSSIKNCANFLVYTKKLRKMSKLRKENIFFQRKRLEIQANINR